MAGENIQAVSELPTSTIERQSKTHPVYMQPWPQCSSSSSPGVMQSRREPVNQFAPVPLFHAPAIHKNQLDFGKLT